MADLPVGLSAAGHTTNCGVVAVLPLQIVFLFGLLNFGGVDWSADVATLSTLSKRP